jgi:hypothetical protein
MPHSEFSRRARLWALAAVVNVFLGCVAVIPVFVLVDEAKHMTSGSYTLGNDVAQHSEGVIGPILFAGMISVFTVSAFAVSNILIIKRIQAARTAYFVLSAILAAAPILVLDLGWGLTS